MKYSPIFLVLLLMPSLFGGSISGTITNATTVDGMMLVVAALHAGITDLTSAPTHFGFFPEFPYDYTITNDAITSMNFYFPVAYMPRGILPASGDPFGARLFPPVIPMGGVATGVDLTLFSSGNIGGNISYSGPFDKVHVNVYDYYSFLEPVLESTHRVGSSSYLLEIIPSGPKRVQAFDDLNGNGTFDDGEPNGFYEMPFIGIDIVLVTGNISGSGINITIQPADIEENDIEKPGEIAISAYPNPFNSAVTIALEGAGECDTPLRIEIYDVAGRMVETVTEPVEVPVGEGLRPSRSSQTTKTGGSKTAPLRNGVFTWTPAPSLPSGVYLVRAAFDDGSGSVSRKITYLK